MNSIETELKLSLPPARNAAFKRLLAAHQPRAAAPLTQHLLSIYFDTPACDLARRDMALRLRLVDGQWLQTLKLGERGGAGLHQRPELEVAVPGEALQLDLIDNRKAREFLQQPQIAGRLSALFTTDIQRTLWYLHDAQGNAVEVALDRGTIRSGQRAQLLNEVEIELKTGTVAALFELALDWSAALPLIPETVSKAARGYYLYAGTTALPPAIAQTPQLHAAMSSKAALLCVLLETLRQLQANVAGLLVSDDPEYVHQARVALRRLRSAQKVFAPLSPAAAAEAEPSALAVDIRWLAALLGQVRDLDVLLTEALPPLEAALGSGFAALKTKLVKQRQRQQRALRQALNSARYGTLLLRLLQQLNAIDVETTEGDDTLRQFSNRALDRCARRVDRLAQQWQTLDALQRHALRKRVKTLRYAVEFFAPLHSQKTVQRYLNKLRALQQVLGAINDVSVARVELAQLTRQHPALAHAAGIVIGWMAGAAQQSTADLQNVIGAWQALDNFW